MAKKKAPVPVKSTTTSLSTRLAKLGIRRDFDLVLHLPLRYEDETRLTPIAAAAPDTPVQVEGMVIGTEVAYRPRRQLVSRIRDETGILYLRFLNFYPNHTKMLAEGATVRVFGEIRKGFLGAEMIHPRFRVVRGVEPLPDALTPIYPATAGLSQSALRKLITRALDTHPMDETLPPAILAPLALPPFRESVDAIHHPRPDSDERALQERTHPAWRRIKFDELLAQQISMRFHYRQRRARTAPALQDKRALTA